jgi:hypothetical protein
MFYKTQTNYWLLCFLWFLLFLLWRLLRDPPEGKTPVERFTILCISAFNAVTAAVVATASAASITLCHKTEIARSSARNRDIVRYSALASSAHLAAFIWAKLTASIRVDIFLYIYPRKKHLVPVATGQMRGLCRLRRRSRGRPSSRPSIQRRLLY